MAASGQRGVSFPAKVASVLPKGYHFGIHHVSTPPTRTDALYSAPPDERPDKTYRESHFLAISIDSASPTAQAENPFISSSPSRAGRAVLAFAIEVLIFTTAYTATIFVSKADSTGYLHLLKLPKSTPSPVRQISAAFVSYLVAHRKRKGILTMVTLFARAQGQYLFPGSVENPGKHVLDDRGLVKWWCKVLNSVLEGNDEGKGAGCEPWATIKGYLIVPGLDDYETKAFLPRTPRTAGNWAIGHPLARISRYTQDYDWVPPRCLIPYYPDDPKSRFRDELDEEAGKWKQTTGAWRSVRTVDEFWDLMAFRAECSSGRLTGFMWLVFDQQESGTETETIAASYAAPSSALLTPSASFDASLPAEPPSTPPRPRPPFSATPRSAPRRLATTPLSSQPTPSRSQPTEPPPKKRKKLSGRVVPRPPHIKTEQRNYLLDRPTSTAYYHWPVQGRGSMIVDEADYKRSTELLLHLDFRTLEKAVASTARWVGETGMGKRWAVDVVGTREVPRNAEEGGSVNNHGAVVVNSLSGLVKRKRQADGQLAVNDHGGQELGPKVNVLSSGLVRKKRKDGEAVGAAVPALDSPSTDVDRPEVNVLSGGQVRKKLKETSVGTA